MARLGSLAMLGTAALGLAACGSSGSTTTVSTPNGSATVKTSNNDNSSSLKITNNKGSVELNSGAGIPAGFPKSIPLPTFLKASGSLGGQSKSGTGFDLYFNATGSLAADLARYDRELRGAGLTETGTVTASGTYEQGWTNHSWNVEVLGVPSSGPGQPATLNITVASVSSNS